MKCSTAISDEMSRQLSREDHEMWMRDLIAYGEAWLCLRDDGAVRYVSPRERAEETSVKALAERMSATSKP